MSKEKTKEISDEEFIELCEEGTTEEILAAINAGANVNAKLKYGLCTETPMGWCLRRLLEKCNEGWYGELEEELISALLDAGFDVNAQVEVDGWDYYFSGPLLCVIVESIFPLHKSMVKRLLAAGADINVEAAPGQTPCGFSWSMCQRTRIWMRMRIHTPMISSRVSTFCWTLGRTLRRASSRKSLSEIRFYMQR